MKTSEVELLDHLVTGMFTRPPKDSLSPLGIHSLPPHTELPRAVPFLGIEVPLNKQQEKLQRAERKQRYYLVSLSSCCIIRLLQKFSSVSLATVTLSRVWLLMGKDVVVPAVIAMVTCTETEQVKSLVTSKRKLKKIYIPLSHSPSPSSQALQNSQ